MHDSTRSTTSLPPADRANIRDASPADAAVVSQLMTELAAYEGEALPSALTEDALRGMLAAADPPFAVLLAELGGRPVGFASFMSRFSIWEACEFMVLDDLYVRAGARQRGIGKALMQELAAIARGRNQTLRWEARIDNHAAHAFYRSLGATLTPKMICRWAPNGPTR